MFNSQNYGKIKTPLDLHYLQITIFQQTSYTNITFIDEFPDHMSYLLCQTDNPVIVGDVNIPWNKTDNLDTISLYEILGLCNLEQHVSTPTHK